MLRTTVLAACCAATALCAEPGLVRDFDATDVAMPRAVFSPGDTTSSLYLAGSPAGKAKGKAVQLTWTPPHGTFMSAQWEDRTPIPGFDRPDLRGTATLSLLCARPEDLGSVLIQFMDSTGQTLQWRRDARALQANSWTTLSFDLASPPEIWGGDGSGRPVPPLALWSVIVDMPATAPAGEVWIDDIVVRPAR